MLISTHSPEEKLNLRFCKYMIPTNGSYGFMHFYLVIIDVVSLDNECTVGWER